MRSIMKALFLQSPRNDLLILPSRIPIVNTKSTVISNQIYYVFEN